MPSSSSVVGGVLELLGAERAAVPAREALASLELDAQHLADERLVSLLVAETEEARRDLRVEHVRDVCVPAAPQDPHVLTTGVHHNLDRRVGEHLRERLGVELVLDRVEHLGPHAAGGVRVGHRDLREAKERLVAPLGDELSVDGEPPARDCALGKLGDHVNAWRSGRSR